MSPHKNIKFPPLTPSQKQRQVNDKDISIVWKNVVMVLLKLHLASEMLTKAS